MHDRYCTDSFDIDIDFAFCTLSKERRVGVFIRYKRIFDGEKRMISAETCIFGTEKARIGGSAGACVTETGDVWAWGANRASREGCIRLAEKVLSYFSLFKCECADYEL